MPTLTAERSSTSASPIPYLSKGRGILGAFAALAIVYVLPTPPGLPAAGQYMLGILLFAVILWVIEAVDYRTTNRTIMMRIKTTAIPVMTAPTTA
jgi:di/tricarboxylate transporter